MKKIERHQAFSRGKSEALRNTDFAFGKSTLRNKRLIQLNNMIMEKLIELNNRPMNEVFAGEEVGQRIAKIENRMNLLERKATDATAAITEIVKDEHLITLFSGFLLNVPLYRWQTLFNVTERTAYRIKGNILHGNWESVKLPYSTAIRLFITYLKTGIYKNNTV